MSGEPNQFQRNEIPPAPVLVSLSIGLVLGLMSIGVAIFGMLWLFAPAFAAVPGVVLFVFGLKFNRVRPLAEGFLAAALFGVLFVAVFAALGT